MIIDDNEPTLIDEWFRKNSSRSVNETLMYLNACICELPTPYMSDSTYRSFNTYFIIGLLPIVGTFGVITNVISFVVFAFGPSDLKSSHYYLAALAASDIAVDWCGMSVIAADSGRRFSDLLNNIQLTVSTYIMPLCTIAQTCSVYFTVLTTVDCFVSLRNPGSTFCRPFAIKRALFLIVASAVLYNAVMFFELKVVTCVDFENGRKVRQEICPTDLRKNPLYMEIYKVYCYAIFIVALPFLLLLLLTVFIVVLLLRKKSQSESSEEQDSPLVLILVVLLFLVCNSIGFAVNMMEIFASEEDETNSDSQVELLYVIDVSNFLVVFNSSANFLVYLTFSKYFRSTLKSKLLSICQTLVKTVRKNRNDSGIKPYRNVNVFSLDPRTTTCSGNNHLPRISVEDTTSFSNNNEDTDQLLSLVVEKNQHMAYQTFDNAVLDDGLNCTKNQANK